MNAPIDISRVILNTDRMVLRPWREADLEDFYEYARVDGVGQMAGWLPHESMDVSREILSHFIEGKKTFALQLGGKVIGSLGIENYKEEEFPELNNLRGRSIGYVLSKDYWGRGLMPEALTEVLRYLFREEKLDFLLVSHYDFNGQSKRVIEKCGFEYIKTIQLQTRYNTTENTLVYLLTKEVWQNANP